MPDPIEPFKPKGIEPKRKPFRKLKAAIPPSCEEIAYRRKLLELTKMVQQMVEEEIIPLFHSKALDSKTVDAPDDNLLDIFTSKMRDIKNRFALITSEFRRMAEEFGTGVNSETQKKFNNMLKSTVGGQTDMFEIIAEEGLGSLVRSQTEENVKLIKSVPDNYLDKISELVQKNFVFGSKTEGGLEAEILPTLRKEIRGLGTIAKKRARLIARDQTSKLNAVLTKARQTNLGIEEYIWSTSKDQRVRGNPSGKYPNVPKSRNHWIREGKVFRWDSPPADGHPGEPINCRCVAIPVIKKKGISTKEIAKSEEPIYSKKEEALIEKLDRGELTTSEFNERMRKL